MSSHEELIFLEPQFHEKIWGGRKLADEFGYQIPDGPIGECWAISAHPAGDCVVKSGAFEGERFSALWANHRELFGAAAGNEFPLLVKILDAADDLSVQVHPDDAYAAANENGSLGKCECWYVLSAEPGATIVVGQRARSREEFEAMVDAGKWDELLNVVPVHAGDFFQIDPGTVHAIKGGTVILETQQSSDVTYRVWDYDRRQADGTLRELHLAKALDVIDYAVEAPESGACEVASCGITTLVECVDYEVAHVQVADDATVTLPSPATFWCASVVSGAGAADGQAIGKGDHFVVPAGFGDLELTGNIELVVSTVPAGA